jgi:predicted nucleic acid-binding protein
MSGPAMLIDTNILVYAEDADAGDKHSIARQLISDLARDGRGALSVQALSEYVSAVTSKLRPPLSPDDAWRVVERFCTSLPVFDLSVDVVRLAAWGAARYQLHIYDAQVWAIARHHRIPVVLTEDIPSAGEIEKVRFVNPFES